MLGISADAAQLPVLGAQSLGQQARQHILRMPRAAPSNAKRHQGARSSDLSSVSSTASSAPANRHALGKNASPASTLPALPALPAHGHRRNHNSRSHKSNGQVHASNANGSPLSNGNVPARDIAAASTNRLHSLNPNGAASSTHSHTPNGYNHARHPAHHVVATATAPDYRRDSVGSSSVSVSSSSVAESFTSHSSIHISDDSHRRIDISAMQNSEIHRDPGQPGPLGLALTVVGLCPACDTIAILVLLMQLGGFLLSLIYMLFTFLTFVPPTAATGFNSLSVATIKEVLQESTFSLSYLTVLLVDSVIFLLWLFLWEPAQNVVLDLAKMVIALTLGGGVSSKGGGWKGILGCLGVIASSHVSHRIPFTFSLRRLFPHLFPVGEMNIHSQPDFASTAITFSGLSAWAKIGRVIIQLLAIHIFSQGVMRYVRDCLLRSQRREMQAHSLPDPEAPEPSSTEPTSAAAEVEGAGAAVVAPQPTPTVASARTKRKQSTQVRLMQPLWAAIASTKIVMKKEMELSGQTELGGKSSELGDMVSAPFHSQEGQIWISDVDSEEAFFATSYFPDIAPAEVPVVDTQHPDSSSLIDCSKPFYVRVNNAIWPSMQMLAATGDEDNENGIRWTGRIQGLPSGCNFVCEFVSTFTSDIIFSTSFRTRTVSSKDADIIASPTQTPRTQRPESPVTTLRSSIKNLESKLADERTRLKTIKRDNQAKMKSQKKELERLSASIQSSGNNDAKYRQKIQSNAHLKQQYEEQADQYDADFCKLKHGNNNIDKCKSEAEAVFNQEKAKHIKLQSEFKAFKAHLDQSIRALESENTTLQNKRNKVATRLAKLDADLGQQESRNTEGLTEVERRRKEAQGWEVDITRAENTMQERIRVQQARNEQLERQIQTIVNTVTAGQYFPQSYGIREEIEPTGQGPENDQGFITRLNPTAPHYNPSPPASAAWPTVNPPGQGFSSNPWSNAGAQVARGLGNLGTIGPGGSRPRGRSSSMLSSISGLTHLSDSDTVMPDGTSTVTATPSIYHAAPAAPATNTTIAPPPGFPHPSSPGFSQSSPPGFCQPSSSGFTQPSPSGFTQPPPPGFPQPSLPGFTQPSPPGLARLPPGLHQLRRSNTVGSARSGSSAGSP